MSRRMKRLRRKQMHNEKGRGCELRPFWYTVIVLSATQIRAALGPKGVGGYPLPPFGIPYPPKTLERYKGMMGSQSYFR